MDFDKSKWLNTYLFTLSSNPIEEKIITLAYISLYCEILLPQTDKKIHEFVLKTY